MQNIAAIANPATINSERYVVAKIDAFRAIIMNNLSKTYAFRLSFYVL